MIFIYIHNTEPFDTSWIELDETGQILQTHIHGNLADAGMIAKTSEVIVAAPAQDVLLTTTELPKLNRQRLMAALPYSLEEQLADDVTQLHFAPADYQPDQPLAVAVVAQQKMNAWIKHLTDAGITPNSIIPATLTLPYVENNWQTSVDNNTAAVRTGKYSGFACDHDNLSAMLSLKLNETENKPECIHIHNSSLQPLNLNTSKVTINEIRIAEKPFLEDLAQTIKRNDSINLLQGVYRPKIKTSQTKMIWVSAACLAIAWFVISMFNNFISLTLLHHENNRLEQAINKIYFKEFPNASSVTAPRDRIEAKLRQITSQAARNAFFNLLSLVGKNLSQSPAIHLQSLEFNENQLNLSVTTDSFNKLDAFTQALTHQGLRVTQKNAAISDKQVKANLFIQAGIS